MFSSDFAAANTDWKFSKSPLVLVELAKYPRVRPEITEEFTQKLTPINYSIELILYPSKSQAGISLTQDPRNLNNFPQMKRLD